MGAVELNEPFGRHDSAFHTREGGCAALASVRLVNMRYPFGYRLKFEAGSVQWDAIGWIVASSVLVHFVFPFFYRFAKVGEEDCPPAQHSSDGLPNLPTFSRVLFCNEKHSKSSCRSLSQQFRPTNHIKEVFLVRRFAL